MFGDGAVRPLAGSEAQHDVVMKTVEQSRGAGVQRLSN